MRKRAQRSEVIHASFRNGESKTRQPGSRTLTTLLSGPAHGLQLPRRLPAAWLKRRTRAQQWGAGAGNAVSVKT